MKIIKDYPEYDEILVSRKSDESSAYYAKGIDDLWWFETSLLHDCYTWPTFITDKEVMAMKLRMR